MVRRKGSILVFLEYNKNQKRIYPKTEIPCDIINAFFLPSLLDIFVTTGITINVVNRAAIHP